MVEQDVFAAFSVADCTHVMETGRVVRAGAVRASKGDTAVINACLGVADQGLPPASG